MRLQAKVFRSSDSWARLCEEVTTWVNENVSQDRLVSVSVSEGGRALFDTDGTVIVWYWE
jgi:hypothetical protein